MHQKYEKFFLKIFVLCVVFFPFLLSCSEDLSTSEEKVESNIEENQDDVPPFVLEIIPSDGAVNLELDTSIEIKFSEEINTLKISVNGGVHSCSGTIQVSNDNFSTCVELISLENHNHENQKLIIRAKDNFSSLTQYKVRVLSDIEDLVGNKMINTVAHKVGFQTGDYLPPVITIVQKIDNHTNDSTPTLIINSNEDGMISSLKECGVIEQNISEGENTIKLSELEDGLYDDCDIYVYDNWNNLPGADAHGTHWNDWEEIWSGVQIIDDVKKGTRDAGDSASNDRRAKTTTQNKTRSGLKKGKVPEKILKTIGNKVVNISVLPKLREQTINFVAKGLKPNKNVYAFFDDTKVTSFVKQATLIGLSNV